MRIKWMGHSCFLITSGNGTTILTDPYHSGIGYRLPEISADIVTTSHGHYDHNNLDVVKPGRMHLDIPGKHERNGIGILGVETFHDAVDGLERGRNIVYKFTVDGVNICHCGDLGHIPSREQVAELGRVDVLLVPVGGTYTLDYEGALEVMELLKPRLTIPMHFKTRGLKITIDCAGKFMEAAGGCGRLDSDEMEMFEGSPGSAPRVVVLKHAADYAGLFKRCLSRLPIFKKLMDRM